MNRDERARRTGTILDHIAAVWRAPERRRMTLALLAAMAGSLTFARIAEDYLTDDPLARWDVSFARWLSQHRDPSGLEFFRAITNLGSGAFVLVVVAIAFAALCRRRHFVDATLLPLAVVGAVLVNLILKLSFQRNRPEVAFIHLETYSFPSGHAMTSTAVYGALAYLLWGRFPSPRPRVLMLSATAVLVGTICFSRLYLGVHYLSDVLAGIAAGFTWLSLAIAMQAACRERVAARLMRGGRPL
jgi:undecaprenyl-diphosphatase